MVIAGSMQNVVKGRYRSYSSFIRERFGERVQKVTIDAGFTCPNRDGTLGRGGCTYCNNDSFSQDYADPVIPVKDQINRGIEAFTRNKPINKFLAYFQSYSNTYADLERLKSLYQEALNHPKVMGLVIGTRPDCVSDDILDHLEELAKDHFISIEYGIESTRDTTLETVNRCHTYEQTVEAIDKTAGRDIHIGGHLILGLPGETIETILDHAMEVSRLPLDFLKLHQLQIIKHTVMGNQFQKEPDSFRLFSLPEYIDLVIRFLELLRPDIVIERFVSQSPPHLRLAPNWGFKNFEIVDKIEKEMKSRDTWQGRLYDQSKPDNFRTSS